MNLLISLSLVFIAVSNTGALYINGCPSSCQSCESGASWDGGQNLDASGYCTAYCSKWGYCGNGEKYTKEGSTYCGGCASSEPTTETVLKKEGEICGSGFWDIGISGGFKWEEECAPGLVCKGQLYNPDAPPTCIRGNDRKRSVLKKEGEICGSGFWESTKWEEDCAPGLVCKGRLYNPDAPPTCIRDVQHTCCNEPYPTYWYEGGFCCNDGKWHPNASDGSGNCYNSGLEPSAPC